MAARRLLKLDYCSPRSASGTTRAGFRSFPLLANRPNIQKIEVPALRANGKDPNLSPHGCQGYRHNTLVLGSLLFVFRGLP